MCLCPQFQLLKNNHFGVFCHKSVNRKPHMSGVCLLRKCETINHLRKFRKNLTVLLQLWQPHAKSWLIGKYSDAERDWGQEEKGMTEDEMAGWHQWLNGRESEWTPGVGDGQGGLACCDSWGRKTSDTTEQLNWTELIFKSPWWFIY